MLEAQPTHPYLFGMSISGVCDTLKVGDIVCYAKRPKERYKLTCVFDHTAWGVRKSDDQEELLLCEYLSVCSK